jgi:hypothetical protein
VALDDDELLEDEVTLICLTHSPLAVRWWWYRLCEVSHTHREGGRSGYVRWSEDPCGVMMFRSAPFCWTIHSPPSQVIGNGIVTEVVSVKHRHQPMAMGAMQDVRRCVLRSPTRTWIVTLSFCIQNAFGPTNRSPSLSLLVRVERKRSASQWWKRT